MATHDELYLNDTWSCYFHNPLDENWNNGSYQKLLDIGSAENFWGFHTLVGDHITNGMFFLMREHVFPCWDDPANINGGCLSMKIPKEEMMDFWTKLCCKLLTETILKPEHRSAFWNVVNGISTSPKRHFCIVKLWIGSPELANIKVFDLPYDYAGEVIYKTNLSNISMENIRLTAGSVPSPMETNMRHELGYVN